MKFFYTLLGLFFLLIAVGIVAGTSENAAAVLLVIGFPAVIILVFKSKIGSKRSQQHEQTMPEPTVTVSVSQASYSIPKKKKSTYRFLGKNESIDVHGHAIKGLVYIGSAAGLDEEPAVIIPRLPAKNSNLSEPLGYYPSYSALTPAQRFRYLEWLASDRGNNEILGDEMGYVFLYFYGFERYAFIDAKTASDRDEILRDIVDEVRRLRSLFAGNRSFDMYSNQLLDAIYILYWPERINERKSAFPTNNPLAAKYAIAKAANDESNSSPLDFDWALHWLLGLGPVNRTKTIREQYPVLRSIFKAVYETATEGGLKVPTCKPQLQLTIQPASADLFGVAEIPVPKGWCDPTGLKRPMTTLTAIHDEVMPAVRALARAVANKDTAGILSSWPPGIPTDSVPKLKKLTQKVESFLSQNPNPELRAAGAIIGVSIEDKATKSQIKQMASAFEVCGFALVPDPIIHPISLKGSDSIVVYKSSRLAALSPEGLWVALSVQLGSLLALADGEVHTREKAILTKVINAHPNTAEREYLHSYLDWRLGHPPSTAGLKKQIEQLAETQRDELAQILVRLALADDCLSKSEIKQLEKLFAQLGFEPQRVSNMLHASTGSSAEKMAGTTVVDTPSKSASGFVLDEAALKAHSESTQEIQGVLSKIFDENDAEDSQDDVSETSNLASGEHWYSGLLDTKHQELLEWLLTAEEWPISSVEEKCRNLGLLSDGALEAINNAAFDALGDGLLEIGDTVEVYHDVLPA